MSSIINICNAENNAATFELLVIDGQQYLYNKKDDSYQPIVVQTEENKENEQQSIDQTLESTNEEKSKVWTNESTLGLIALVEEYQKEFQNSIKKYVWMKISKILQDKFGFTITWQQCDTKWKGLLKMYKDIKEHNSTSGKARKRWEYFEVMNKILHDKPEITPVATCSSSKGLTINEELSSTEESTKEDSMDERHLSVVETKELKSSFSRKRKIINPVERRHQEKMQRFFHTPKTSKPWLLSRGIPHSLLKKYT